jgi:hypothetical protein
VQLLITFQEFITLVDKLIWPLVVLMIYLLNISSFRKIFRLLVHRIEKGAPIEISSFKVGSIPVSLPSPRENEKINENHLALLHSSWRYAKKDIEFGKKMFVIQVIIQANEDVLNKIEYVRYLLHPSYPNKVQIKTNRSNHFELKELAWGEFNLRSEVKIKGQDEVITLSRYINLVETGDNLLNNQG